MKKFSDWWEENNGFENVNLSPIRSAKKAWDYQQKEVDRLRQQLNISKLIVNYADQCVGTRNGSLLLSWRDNKDGTESECIVKASAAVQLEREKANG